MENDKINMKKNKNILSIILLIFMLFSLICSNSLAHGGNIKGWKVDSYEASDLEKCW